MLTSGYLVKDKRSGKVGVSAKEGQGCLELTWNICSFTGARIRKRRRVNLSPFFFACFLLDSAAILY